MAVFYGIIIFIFGLIFGSFLNCMAIRITKKEDWVRGRSHCPECGHILLAKDLVPVISFLSTGGKCRYCGKKISARYPITELTFGILVVFMYVAYALPVINELFNPGGLEQREMLRFLVLFVRNAAFTGALFVASLVDLSKMEIPDGCLIFGIIVWAVTFPFIAGGGVKEVFISSLQYIAPAILVFVVMLLISIFMDAVLHRESLGGGDIKLFSVCALYLGAAGSYELILFSCIAGLIFVYGKSIITKSERKAFPFGPSIAFAAYFLLIFEKHITTWYFSLLA